jgi:hypothetical protein
LGAIAGGGSAWTFNPMGLEVGADFNPQARGLHPRVVATLLAPVAGLPLTLGAGAGVSFF